MPDQYIEQILEGDKNAFRHIIRECQDGAFNLAFSILKEEHAAKDAVQRSFLNVYENLKSFRRESRFKTWFHRIVVNEAFQMLRKRGVENHVKPGGLRTLKSNVDRTREKIDHDHKMFFINETLDRMKPDESLSLKLFYLEEYGIKEMVEITGWSTSKTKVTLHRARKSMKELMEDLFNLNPEKLYHE
jgi:RNA polymerase sigma-70 factor (ECF subfamily)